MPTPGLKTRESDENLLSFLTGFLPEGERIVRRAHIDQEYSAIPRDPTVRIAVSTVQIGPGQYNDYHVHNGTAVYMVLQGKIDIEFPDGVRHYETGDAYIEPIGVVHRAYNPDPHNPATFVGFLVTAADREHITNLAGFVPGGGDDTMTPASRVDA
jgi:quercetin dioxygenase-like cupin family protein